MLKPLTEAERDYAYSEAFLSEWLKDSPAQIKEHLKILASAVSAYREKYATVQQDYDSLKEQHDKLLAGSSQFLEFMRQQAERLNETEELISEQREVHQQIMRNRGIEVTPTIDTI